ncbi:MAG: bifunctional phosphopantothenoylcysteine decarboxylase/phosphopantothenate--cysteine ligase CoaBC [Candidatus Lokiarchaeota archaeon]|nr:bifunctional phosphopantothenoylcysteine decarboxylase/phosphopantothenate--cysteine ligase CoaBC [Candidatus Lokiarchaeota archaeon]
MNKDHPSKEILESKGTILRGKTICLCVTGSVAIIQAPIISRELMRLGAEVVCVMTRAATKLLGPDLMHWATGNPTITKLTGNVEHVYLAGQRPKRLGKADLILICPATANTISKIATGIDDTVVTTVVTTAFGTQIPIIIVPAMHESMFNHPILEENILKLKRLGVDILGPRISEGKAKIARVDDIIQRVIDLVHLVKDLEGKRFLITAGPTREYIDEIRFISNKSSGRMGVELAKEVKVRGGDVLLIYGKGTKKVPAYIDMVPATSTKEFLNIVKEELTKNKYDFFISAAAISDYTPKEYLEGKISSSKNEELSLGLRLTPKIIDIARETDKNVFIVGFKAETKVSEKELIERAYKRLIKSNIDLIVANDVGRDERGFGTKTNEVFIIDKDKNIIHVPLNTKRYIASKIIDVSLEIFRLKNY